METLRSSVLVLSVLSLGLMAGVFGLYAHAIMPGLRTTDDRTFVGAFQAIDRAIINPLFMTTFFAALLLTGLAALLHVRDHRSVLPWIAAALVLYLATFAITIGVHVPLNDAIKAAGAPVAGSVGGKATDARPEDRVAFGDPGQIGDLAAVRRQFDEARWHAWNVARAVMSTGAFACLAWALVLHGRAEA